MVYAFYNRLLKPTALQPIVDHSGKVKARRSEFDAAKKALITGITGQDGAHLAQLLLSKGYEVHGLARRSSTSDVNLSRLQWLGIEKGMQVYRRWRPARPGPENPSPTSSRTNSTIWRRSPSSPVLAATGPDGQRVTGPVSSPTCSKPSAWQKPTPVSTRPRPRKCNGLVQQPVQSETTPFYPRSPLCGRQALRPLDHRQLPRKFCIHASSGIPLQPRIRLRGIEFVTRKVTRQRRPHRFLGLSKELRLENTSQVGAMP